MANACSFFLESGRPCGAPALHDSNWCRHHTPTGLRQHSQNGNPAPQSAESGYVLTKARRAGYWRTFDQGIDTADAETLNDNMECLFDALANNAICHRSAGRLFAAIARRRLELGIGEFANRY